MEVSEIYTAYMYSYPHKTAYRPISVRVREELARLSSSGLYFHIPFCETKCGYCNLFSVTGREEAYFNRYLDAMRRQADAFGLFGGSIYFDSLTVGGGTPLLLSSDQLDTLLRLADRLTKAPGCIETAPKQTTQEKLAVLKSHGIGRVSMGVQSFLDSELRTLGRVHSAKSAGQALTRIRDIGFSCVNLDLIYGVQGQTEDSLRYSLEAALSYQPDEIFAYPLYIRAGTALQNRAQVSGDTYNLYLFLRDFLTDRGYLQTSMRRFVKGTVPDGECCGFENTVSLGCGGRSYLGNLHICAPYSDNRQTCLAVIDTFVNTPEAEPFIGYRLNAEEQKRRYVIKNLLHVAGIDASDYRNRFGGDVTEEFPLLGQMEQKGYLLREGPRIQLTARGLSYSDYIGPQFISPEVRNRMKR